MMGVSLCVTIFVCLRCMGMHCLRQVLAMHGEEREDSMTGNCMYACDSEVSLSCGIYKILFYCTTLILCKFGIGTRARVHG